MLALDTGQAVGQLSGKQAKDPTFGLDAVWIAPGDADAATGQGYLVVDPGTVIATHLNHKLAQHSAELLGPDEVQSLLDGLKERAEHLVASLSPQLQALPRRALPYGRRRTALLPIATRAGDQIGRAAGRERVCQYV